LVPVRETNQDWRVSAAAEKMAVYLLRQRFRVEQRFSAAAEFQGFILFIQICNAYIIQETTNIVMYI
jgi:hypothetical protein